MHAEPIYAGTIFSPSAYGFSSFPPQDNWRCGQGPKLDQGGGKCHAIAEGGTYREMDEI